MKKVFLKLSKNSLENTCDGVFFLIKLQGSGLGPATLLKKTPTHMLYNDFVKFLRTSF